MDRLPSRLLIMVSTVLNRSLLLNLSIGKTLLKEKNSKYKRSRCGLDMFILMLPIYFQNMSKFELITVLQLGKSSYRDETLWSLLAKLGDFELGNKHKSSFVLGYRIDMEVCV